MSETVELLELDAGLTSEAVFIKDAKSERTKWIVWELPTPELEDFMEVNKATVETTIVDGKLQIKGIKTFKGMFSSLLKRCVKDESGKLVDIKILNSWPPRVQQKLYDIANKLNALTKEAQDEVGNSQAGNENG